MSLPSARQTGPACHHLAARCPPQPVDLSPRPLSLPDTSLSLCPQPHHILTDCRRSDKRDGAAPPSIKEPNCLKKRHTQRIAFFLLASAFSDRPAWNVSFCAVPTLLHSPTILYRSHLSRTAAIVPQHKLNHCQRHLLLYTTSTVMIATRRQHTISIRP